MPGPAPSVLITRPEPGARETAARVALRGFSPILAPVLRIHTLPARLPPAATLGALLVTSGNAVAPLPRAHHVVPLFAVGDATAERARAAGFATVHSAAGDAAALAALVTREVSTLAGPLLLAAGRGQGNQLAALLRQAGYRVVRRVVYAAEPETNLAAAAAGALAARVVTAALFFSAETARHFVTQVQRAGLAGTLATVDAISIGEAAAVALQALSWRRIRVAARPTQDDMLALLDD
jgi:uroporphyrinogen-III synthase